jgi:hypothetical protein
VAYSHSLNTIFILGAPRSGTTWAAKIFDSRPDVVYRHEPDIVDRNEDLPYLPTRADIEKHLDGARRWLDKLVTIRTVKTVGTWPIFPKQYHTALQTAVRRVMILGLKAASRVPLVKDITGSIEVPDYLDLNSGNYSRIVVKSISAMGRAGLLAAASPESRFILILRHPCGNVGSVQRGVRWSRFDGKNPIEGLADTAPAQRRNLTEEKINSLSFAAQLAWNWVISSEMALEALRDVKHLQILRYEDLAKDPEGTTRRLFAFCGLEWREETAAFLRESTDATGREGYYQVKRNPSDAANKWRKELTQSEIDEICEIAAQSEPGRMFLSSADSRSAAVG